MEGLYGDFSILSCSYSNLYSTRNGGLNDDILRKHHVGG